MRIISGIYKGRTINYVKNFNTRPLKDSVRENIFNILIHSKFTKLKIENSNILDLYSGIGSFGLECISRGAKKVSFVEQDPNAINILKENLNKLSIIEKVKIYNSKIEHFLSKNIKEKFDIFFFDPPFADTIFLKNLEIFKIKKIFKKDHIVIIHREISSEETLENLIKIYEIKKYGRSKIFFGAFR